MSFNRIALALIVIAMFAYAASADTPACAKRMAAQGLTGLCIGN